MFQLISNYQAHIRKAGKTVSRLGMLGLAFAATTLVAPEARAGLITTYDLEGSIGFLFSRTDTNPNAFRMQSGIGDGQAPVAFQFHYDHEKHSGQLVADLIGGVYQANDYNLKATNDLVKMKVVMNYTGLSPNTDLILGRNYATNPPEFIADGTGTLELSSNFLLGIDRPVTIDLADRYYPGGFSDPQLNRAGGDPFNVGLDLLLGSIFGLRGWVSTESGQFAFSPSNYYNFSGDFYGKLVGSSTHEVPDTEVPEPASMSLLALGALGACVRKRKQAL